MTNAERSAGGLPNLIVIGAMKCGTSAVHGYLDDHPEITMSEPKELNFFFGPALLPVAVAAPDEITSAGRGWEDGNRHRGLGWYAAHFAPGAPVRGESSPGYTSPSHPDVARRMAALVPDARLVYLVRDPIERAVSQYRHHRADGTEHRPLEEALLDPDSQYVSRGRYHERLAPFLTHYGRERIFIASLEELLADGPATLRSLYAFTGVNNSFVPAAFRACRASIPDALRPGTRLHRRLADLLRDDAACLRRIAGREFPDWSV